MPVPRERWMRALTEEEGSVINMTLEAYVVVSAMRPTSPCDVITGMRTAMPSASPRSMMRYWRKSFVS